ncbi:MAG: hypothetical protein RIC57_03610 [Balneola sp.]
MSYTVIAQENIRMANATSSGSKEERTFVILERFSDEETVTEIGISGEPLFVMGSRGNDMFYSFSPIQIQFSIVDQFGLLKKFSNRNKKDFKLQVKNGATVEYELYLYLPSNNSEYYETNPEIDLVATNAIGLLKEEYFKPSDTLIEFKDFLFECLNRLGFDYAIEVYSLWSSADNAKTFPLGYRVNRSYQVRFKNSDRVSFYEVLENFCQQFNLQLKQIDNTWIFIERKRLLNAPATLNGIDLETELPVARSFAAVLNADTVLRKPKSQFKPGLKEIKTEFKLFDEFLVNADFSDSNFKNQIAVGWEQPAINDYLIASTSNPQKLVIPNLNASNNISIIVLQSNDYDDLDGNPVGYLNGYVRQEAKKSVTDEDILSISWSAFTNSGGTGNTKYAQIKFRSLDGLIYTLDNNLADWNQNDTSFILDTGFVNNEGSVDIYLSAPTGKIGFITVEFTCLPVEPGVNGYVSVYDINIDFKSTIERDSKYYINSRGLKNTQVDNRIFGAGDLDDDSDLFVIEYFDTNNEWIPAEYISNDGSVRSIFQVAPYQRMCQANKDQIEYSTIRTWKYLYPDFLQTILFDQANDTFLYTIPIEIKWNMVTGEIEIFSAEAFEDTTGVTQLQFNSEEEYDAIDSETVITDQGDVVTGFTRGVDSEDGRGFEVEFELPESITESSAIVEVGGVNYELDTLILEN